MRFGVTVVDDCFGIWVGNCYLYLSAQLHRIARQHIAGLAYRVVDELDVAVQNVAAHVFDQTAQVADRNGLNLCANPRSDAVIFATMLAAAEHLPQPVENRNCTRRSA